MKRIVEAILFSFSNLSEKKLKEVLKISSQQLKELIEELNEDYKKENHSFRIRKIGNHLQMVTLPEYGEWIEKISDGLKNESLSKVSTEVLAIIAYNQPITKPDIDRIRGVDSGWILSNLLKKGFVRIKGRDKRPGHPFLYTTTQKFLEHFGLETLEELPPLDKINQ